MSHTDDPTQRHQPKPRTGAFELVRRVSAGKQLLDIDKDGKVESTDIKAVESLVRWGILLVAVLGLVGLVALGSAFEVSVGDWFHVRSGQPAAE